MTSATTNRILIRERTAALHRSQPPPPCTTMTIPRPTIIVPKALFQFIRKADQPILEDTHKSFPIMLDHNKALVASVNTSHLLIIHMPSFQEEYVFCAHLCQWLHTNTTHIAGLEVRTRQLWLRLEKNSSK